MNTLGLPPYDSGVWMEKDTDLATVVPRILLFFPAHLLLLLLPGEVGGSSSGAPYFTPWLCIRGWLHVLRDWLSGWLGEPAPGEGKLHEVMKAPRPLSFCARPVARGQVAAVVAVQAEASSRNLKTQRETLVWTSGAFQRLLQGAELAGKIQTRCSLVGDHPEVGSLECFPEKCPAQGAAEWIYCGGPRFPVPSFWELQKAHWCVQASPGLCS